MSKLTRNQRRQLKKMLEPFFGNQCPICQKTYVKLDDFNDAIFGKGKGRNKIVICSTECWSKYSDQPIKEPSQEVYLTPVA
jgi:hypothetical protein